ncbi:MULTISPECIES: diguanylate cyclase [Psychrilyobacter]|uniref:Diguanylate cyclase n=1 Tax=Psychrilyobacter piezotolerans TaxID=2293438 RepID=A0ABX9KIK9_9FUSO|nr:MULTISPECIES: diguanylate cyclase [Psychrilyobacter]MCS5421644.1 diguanylate cyclase [Psychrilyobacter sp. S5]NDI77212.1 diguanylate cyclase [Psychrilyobacter piezotolerans]RDE63271.1 diguanylate cyclase [Psychrilyobacter sp. S5]REI41813.1 diguanylate cyclase [Psychrilyobacter piezotolerans]
MNGKILNSYSSKVVFALMVVSIIPLFIYLQSNNLMVKNYFSVLENKNVESRIDHADKILQSELEDLIIIAKDYAAWDDTYEIMAEEDPDMDWVKENISEWIPSNFGMDFLLLTRNDMTIVDAYGLEEGGDQELFNKSEVRDILNGKYDDSIGYKKGEFPNGITMFNGKPYILSVTPVLTSDFEGPSRGALILGREISPAMLQNIKEKFGYDISIGLNNKLISTPETQIVADKFSDLLLKNEKKIIKINDHDIVGQKIIPDISGLYKIRLYIFDSRYVFVSTLKLLKTNGNIVMFFSVGLILLLSYILKNVIVNPIISLQKQLVDMNQFNTLEYIDIKGATEIKSMAQSFNTLVENLTVKEHENRVLKQQNHTDELTSLYNHRHFHQTMKHKINSEISSISIIFLDIDKFKVVNDLHGHVVGDRILKTIGEILNTYVPENLHAFRYGGEEFVVIAENYTLNETYLLAEKLRSEIVKSNALQNQCDGLPITVSVGLASCPEHTKNPLELLNKADRAMYFAKQNGRNQTYIYNKNIENFLKENNKGFRQKEVLLDSALAFAAAIDAKDKYTGKHSEMVTKFSLLLAEKLGLSKEDKYVLRIGALLHDCGKIGIPDYIIGKTAKLTSEEYEIIKTHPVLGNTILKYIINDETVMSCVRNHHEKWDGSGYPDGLSREEISLHARIVTLADSFHAMVSQRPYRNALSIDTAIEELRKNSGTQFDPSLVEIFIQSVQESYEV